MTEWRTWGGGVMPVDCDAVLYRLRLAPDRTLGPTDPRLLRWDHGRTSESAADASLRRNDIIAYRALAQAIETEKKPTRHEVGSARKGRRA